MTDDEVLKRAGRYVPELHTILAYLSAHGVPPDDLHEATVLGFFVVALRRGETDEARAVRKKLLEEAGAHPVAPSRRATLLEDIRTHYELLENVWRIVRLEAAIDGVEADPFEVLTTGLRIIQTEKALVLLGLL